MFKEYIYSFAQKLGFWSKDLTNAWHSKENWIWFHAVSVGELNGVWPLIIEINKSKPEYPIMISTTTKSGYLQAKSLTKNNNKPFTLLYFPFDLPSIITSLLNNVKIKILIIAETEIWPTLLNECHKRDIPTILVNARLSDKSFKNYSLLKFYFKNIINLFSKVLAQSSNDGEKFKKLGIEETKLKILGNLKFSQSYAYNNSCNNITNINNNLNIIFASTHRGEEEIAISVFENLLNNFSNIRLIIAPRHIERTNEITKLIKQNSFIPILKTENREIKSKEEILVLNTIGELTYYYKISAITVLGGTFVKIGGHNILEPIREKSYTIIGPYDFKISELSNVFKRNNAIVQVNNVNELIIKLNEALADKQTRDDTINNGIKIINENANILEQTTQHILSYL